MLPQRTVQRVILTQRVSLGRRLRLGTGGPWRPARRAISHVDGTGDWVASTSRAVRSIIAALWRQSGVGRAARSPSWRTIVAGDGHRPPLHRLISRPVPHAA